ncbi:probable 39S ribosomal protein L23, mitochondrial [Amphibalanus amphitrite]|uniref:probable 39S ribosomal protein L23, mitochondrial n=1 Tax=Amphibalanus amphitrite TaxID=1232801 RepID=UPI001C8FF5A1|nr:probable 39S ribosomal protein L23, mitochondrial [Amphibalanus amphitrite]XP_043196527.1 probable 39S ribosomal protein L23, mitochondrial [Amphibalanus amphitrite]XP_043196528.1 probable 39S ribosomal protein L23, mitochondrial [Amphibalanus amphitrite]XP_043196529.1 probable 39S ribosomal protein L23, mitochondrial [Amphibalanus amphitrite]
MSTRLYPLYQRGNPQLRIFLPNFWMKLLKPTHPIPPNAVQFMVSPEMTKHDVKQYLEKIYNVPVVEVNIANKMGKLRRTDKGYIVKDDDLKYAFVTLPKDMTFEFPNLMSEEKKQERSDQMKEIERVKDTYKKDQDRFKDRPGVPTWFN